MTAVTHRRGSLRVSRFAAVVAVSTAVALAIASLGIVLLRLDNRQQRMSEAAVTFVYLALASSQEVALQWRYVDTNRAITDDRLETVATESDELIAHIRDLDEADDTDVADYDGVVAGYDQFRERQDRAVVAPVQGRVRWWFQTVATSSQQSLNDLLLDQVATTRGEAVDTRTDMALVGAVMGAVLLGALALVIAEWRRALRRLRKAGFEDALTKLRNRAELRRVYRRMTRNSARPSPASILLDLDDFKEVNDTHGHRTGDALLIEVARMLERVVGDDGIPGRLGGDEFAILIAEGRDPLAVAERIDAAFRRPFVLGDLTVTASASVGVNPEGGSQDPIGAADLAMYEVKRSGKRGVRVFTPELAAKAGRRTALRADVRHAVERNELWVAYQPVVDATTGDLAYLEALARWEHPGSGSVSPAIFIPIAEELRIVDAIDDFVLHRAAHDAAAADVGVSVNVSPQHLLGGGWAPVVAAVLAESGLAPHRLVIEVTESVFTGDHDAQARAIDQLDALSALGVRIAMDDFGTGQSSLSRLAQLPLDILKVDRSFLAAGRDIRHGGRAPRDLLPIIAQLAQQWGLETVVEGVESAEQLELARDLGFDHVQGFAMASPQPSVSAALAALRTYRSLPADRFVPHPAISPDAAASVGGRSKG